MRVLVVEDEPKMAELLRRGLHEEGLVADVALSGAVALQRVADTKYDVIVLDVMLPDISGIAVCRQLRADGVWSPVLILTARDDIQDRVAGLDAGADDYLVKPFAFDELLARIRALLRRGTAERPAVLEVEGLRLDPATHRVWALDEEVSLTPREFALLETFMRRPDQVLTRDQLLEQVWDLGSEQRSNVVDVYVRFLRSKLDGPYGRQTIETVRGVGYRLAPLAR
ncbi:MAG: two-component system, OmpR family, response regulator [Pseudonocardiales bacterium]|nr:response regulator transcription factor [Pseudonocardiales bacterium]MDT4963106.1 two-component system, OmpR family, response regulator [Pseudonocardiales bacterium]MDT4975407.1 two-component system, OmpR family, response regulator [Pseudonocardiales bacterium]MDT4979643.1 two-component system, OmpR family, response regulator [Pseudonocardiales bacterium]MDT4985406.1 two-component system, OmpR family, response regulator [Pseudonocardiales bacterium]